MTASISLQLPSCTVVRKRPLRFFLALSTGLMQILSPAGAADLDLSSTTPSMNASEVLSSGSVTINSNGTEKTVTPSSLITPAEAVAIRQVLSGGTQTLVLGAQGNAVGGNFAFTAVPDQQLSSLLIPHGVVAVRDFGLSKDLNITGNFSNAGSFYAISTNQATTTASILAGSITNLPGALLTSVIPASGLPGVVNLVSNLNLYIGALNSITNAGTISSAANLTVSAGGSIVNALDAGTTGMQPIMQAANNLNLISGLGNITNSGLISAAAGNLNIASQMAANLTINNLSGILQAPQGNINIRDALFNGSESLSVLGGQLLAQELNVFSGSGIADLHSQSIDALLNVSAGGLHLSVSQGQLNLGEICSTGDPTFYNNAGSINIGGNITAGEALSIVASRDITTSVTPPATLSIIANDPLTGAGANIILIAGANFTSSNGATSATVGPFPGTGNAAGPVSIDGTASATGGKIDFSGSNVQISASALPGSNQSSGNVLLAAYSDAGGSRGEILLSASTPLSTSPFVPAAATSINAAGDGTGNNGNVTLISGHSGTTAVMSGPISASGGSGTAAGTGQISISTAQPTLSSGTLLTFMPDGSISTGNTLVPSVLVQPSGVGIYGDITASNSISITAGGNIQAFNQEIARIDMPSGFSPEGVAISKDGTSVYVSSLYADAAGTVAGVALNQINTSTNTATNLNQLVGPNPEGVAVAVTANGPVVFVANRNGLVDSQPNFGTATFVDPATGNVIANPTVGYHPIGLSVNSAGTFVYVADRGTNDPVIDQKGSFSVVNAATGQTVTTVPVGHAPQTISVDPTDTFAYVASRNDSRVYIVRTATNTVDGHIDTLGTDPIGVAINPVAAYTQAYVTNRIDGNVAVIDTSKSQTTGTLITVGTHPDGVAFNPAGTTAYITNEGSKLVSVINTATNTVVDNVDVGKKPGVFGAFAGFVNGHPSAYVSNVDDNNVSAIRMPILSAPNLSLRSSGGNIIVGSNANVISANTSGTGMVSVTQQNSLTIANSSAGTVFQVGSSGVVNVAGTVSAPSQFITGSAVLRISSNADQSVTTVTNPARSIITPAVSTSDVVEKFNQTSTVRVPTDLIRFSVPLHGEVSRNDLEAAGDSMISGVYLTGDSVDTAQVDSWLRSGVALEQASAPDTFDLKKGNVLAVAKRRLSIVTEQGLVELRAGTSAWIMVSEDALIVYNLDDNANGGLSLVLDGKRFVLPLGRLLLLSRDPDSFDRANPAKQIAVRNLEKIQVTQGGSAYLAEFSIPSLFNHVRPVNQLMKSASGDDLKARLLKNAAIVSTIRPGAAYKEGSH